MRIEIKSYTSTSNLISAIIFFILGAIMFTSPDVMIVVISRVIGSIIAIIGVFNCIKNYIEVKKDNTTSSIGMISGIIGIVIGLVFISLASVIEALIRFLIGGWILFIGVNRLINVLYLKKQKTKFIVLLIVAILLIGAGLYTILEANLAFQAIGLVLMIYAILEIFSYIFCKKEVREIKPKENDNIIDAVVVKDVSKNKKGAVSKLSD